MAFSREELLFVRESLLRGIRTDLRNPRESRRVEFQALDIPQADGSLRVTRGHTKLKVSLQFKEAEEEKFFPQGDRRVAKGIQSRDSCGLGD